MLLYIKVFILSLVEGMTEFIPVSSTGHLLVTSELLNFDIPSKNLFIIVIQLGAILAVCYEYRKKLIDTLLGLFSKNKKENKTAWNFALNLLIAFIPTVIAGVFLYGLIKDIFSSEHNLLIIGSTLILGGIIFLLIEKYHKNFKTNNVDKISFKQSLSIGLCQIISMIPGASRSGATIVGGMLSNLDRKTATEFSFFLAIPTMFAATIYDIYKNWSEIQTNDFILILIGFIISYISALIVIRVAINYLKKNSFKVFANYRILAGLFCIVYYFYY